MVYNGWLALNKPEFIEKNYIATKESDPFLFLSKALSSVHKTRNGGNNYFIA